MHYKGFCKPARKTSENRHWPNDKRSTRKVIEFLPCAPETPVASQLQQAVHTRCKCSVVKLHMEASGQKNNCAFLHENYSTAGHLPSVIRALVAPGRQVHKQILCSYDRLEWPLALAAQSSLVAECGQLWLCTLLPAFSTTRRFGACLPTNDHRPYICLTCLDQQRDSVVH